MDAKPTQQFPIVSKKIWLDVLKFASKEQIEKLKELGILSKLKAENEGGNIIFYNCRL